MNDKIGFLRANRKTILLVTWCCFILGGCLLSERVAQGLYNPNETVGFVFDSSGWSDDENKFTFCAYAKSSSHNYLVTINIPQKHIEKHELHNYARCDDFYQLDAGNVPS